MSELRDPLDRVSNSLRRAVSINKSQETDLRSTMSTIQRERRRSVNSWSLKQEKFLRAKQKFMPAHKPQAGRRLSQAESMVTSPRRLPIVRGVSPESVVEMKPIEEFATIHATSQTTGTNLPRNPLPPLIVPRKRTKHSDSEGLTAPGPAICNPFLQEPLGPTESQLRRARRVSEYKAAMSTDGETKSLQRRVRRFTKHRQPTKLETPERISVNQEDDKVPIRNSLKNVSMNTNFGKPRAEESQNEAMPYRQEIFDDKFSKRRHTLSNRDNSFRKRLLPLTIQEEGEGEEEARSSTNKTAQENWGKLRRSLKSITKPSKRNRDVGKMSLIEMTRLFEEIRECRYLRVGHNTSFRGDNATGAGCKCLACTVKDKAKLKNNLSAPQ